MSMSPKEAVKQSPYDDKKQKHRGHHFVPEEEIALRAYQIWQELGCTHGHDHEDWLQSEVELHAKTRDHD